MSEKIILSRKTVATMEWSPSRGWMPDGEPAHPIISVSNPRPSRGDKDHRIFFMAGGTISDEEIAELHSRGVLIEYE